MAASIGDLTVAAARDDEELFAKLVDMTGMSARRLSNVLSATDGRTRLRNALQEDLRLDYESLCQVSVAQARAWGIAPDIEREFGVPSERVEDVLASVHGRTLLKTAFQSEEAGAQQDCEPVEALVQDEAEPNSGDEAGSRFANLGPDWSRPRLMSRVFQAVGWDAPTKLRAERFQALLTELRMRGVQACLAEDPTQSVLGPEASSPGMAAKLRLRKAEAEEPLAVSSTEAAPDGAPSGWSRLRPIRTLYGQLGMPLPTELTQDEFSALIEALELRGYEVATADGARLTPLHDAVPLEAEIRLRHDAVAVAPSSVRGLLGEATAQESSGVQKPTMGDYERAALRLELLTAGLDVTKLAEDWPEKWAERAASGLALQGQARELLAQVAVALAGTPRHPLAVLTALVRRLEPEDGEVLLREYGSLGAGDSAQSRLLAEHWRALCMGLGMQ